MSNRIRSILHKKIIQSIDVTGLPILSNLTLKHENTNDSFVFQLLLKRNNYDLREKAQSIVQNHENIFDNLKLSINNNYETLLIGIDRNTFIKEILEANKHEISVPTIDDCSNKNIVVEYSSPNIAKPFHVGHLRSSIIGNYISNINKFLNNNVVRINYLGDWGTQLGLLKLGMDLSNVSDDAMKADPIKELYRVYVHANKLAETDPSIVEKAREIFSKLENGDPEQMKDWEKLKEYTTVELEKTYRRINIIFDEYNWESSYNAVKIKDLIDQMKKSKILRKDLDGKWIVRLKRNIPIIKSDGSTLYMSRDIAAAIDRAEKYNFDRMYYVVDSSQFDHFDNLFNILRKMEYLWADKLEHIKFGKIQGMSTRKGTALFLTDILDEAKTAMKERQLQTSTTKVLPDLDDNSSDVLGISAVIVNDLKQRRGRDYEFNWNSALDSKGETGVKLQYTHCRLVSLKENCGAELAEDCDPSLLKESIVNELVATISQFDEAVISSYQTLEACHVAKYLFRLSHVVNKTLKELKVKGEPSDVASQRLLLYQAAKNVLNTGMKLLGLTPLNKM